MLDGELTRSRYCCRAAEVARLQAEVDRLRKELASFDPSFFEELEDLKYNYDLEVKKNRLLEEQLHSAKAKSGGSPVR